MNGRDAGMGPACYLHLESSSVVSPNSLSCTFPEVSRPTVERRPVADVAEIADCSQKLRKISDARLAKDFQTILNDFQAAQKSALEKETMFSTCSAALDGREMMSGPNPKPETSNLTPHTSHLKTFTLEPQPQSFNLKLQTSHVRKRSPLTFARGVEGAVWFLGGVQQRGNASPVAGPTSPHSPGETVCSMAEAGESWGWLGWLRLSCTGFPNYIDIISDVFVFCLLLLYPSLLPRQDMLVVENELVYNEAVIEERDQGIQDIQQQIGQVNEIFRDLAVLVKEQGHAIGEPPTLVACLQGWGEGIIRFSQSVSQFSPWGPKHSQIFF